MPEEVDLLSLKVTFHIREGDWTGQLHYKQHLFGKEIHVTPELV